MWKQSFPLPLTDLSYRLIADIGRVHGPHRRRVQLRPHLFPRHLAFGLFRSSRARSLRVRIRRKFSLDHESESESASIRRRLVVRPPRDQRFGIAHHSLQPLQPSFRARDLFREQLLALDERFAFAFQRVSRRRLFSQRRAQRPRRDRRVLASTRTALVHGHHEKIIRDVFLRDRGRRRLRVRAPHGVLEQHGQLGRRPHVGDRSARQSD